MSEHRVKPETTKLHPALTTGEDTATRMTCFNDDFTPSDVHLIYFVPFNLFQLGDLLRYNDIVLFMCLGAVSLLYNHFLGCFTPLGG